MNCWGKGSRRIQNKGILTGRADGQQGVVTLFSLVFLGLTYKKLLCAQVKIFDLLLRWRFAARKENNGLFYVGGF